METKLLWIIPGGGYNLEDGNPITYNLDLQSKKDHPDYCQKFCMENGIDCSHCHTHLDYAKILTSLRMIVVFNSAVPIDGKYFCSIFLPEQMTEKQINFLEKQSTLFQEKYYEKVSFFRVKVYTSVPFTYTYKITDNFRDLKIENIIANNSEENGQKFLYQEVNRQKEEIINARRK